MTGQDIWHYLAQRSDDELAQLIQREQYFDLAFEELLVRRYERRLAAWFWSWTVPPQDIPDLIAEVHLSICQHRLASYEPQGHFASYLYRIAHNVFINRGRKIQRSPHTCPLSDTESTSPSNGPAQQVEQIDTVECIQRAVDRLPEEQRQVIQLTLDGWKPRDIAQHLQRTAQWVSGILFDARRALEQELQLSSRKRAYNRSER